mgnify:CR=1 FL=1
MFFAWGSIDLFTDNYETVDNFADAEAVLVRSASMHEMEMPESLLAIARAGAGTNNIPKDKCSEKGIVVFNTPGANANAVKEMLTAVVHEGTSDRRRPIFLTAAGKTGGAWETHPFRMDLTQSGK